MPYRRLIAVTVAVALACAFCARAAYAQGSARSLDLDPSVRASGMGGASNAVFWDGGNQWSNPALLGYQHGIRYEWGETQLVPGLATDVYFRTNVLELGGGGFSVALSGKPGIGGLKLDYGMSEGSDDQGNPTGPYHSFEEIDSWGFGVSLGRATEGIAQLFGHDPPAFSRYGDVSFGMYSKEVEIQFGETFVGETSAHDVGLLVRLSPLEWFPPTRDGLVDVDFAYGWSMLSYDGERVFGTPPSEHDRNGKAVRAALVWPEEWFGGSSGGWFMAGFNPMLSVAAAFDNAEIGVGNFTYDTEGKGYEITVANLFSYRTGHYEDLEGHIDDSTDGWSVGLPIGKLGGLRYDRARFPQASDADLPKVEREAYSFWMDPLAIWSFLKH